MLIFGIAEEMSKMEVSIIIPVYNRAEMVRATLDSVKAQTHRPIHLVLVDNNSTDNTLQVLNNFKAENETSDFTIDVIEERNPGACAARNSGAKLAKGEWLMFFDSDDTMDDCLVAEYVRRIQESKDDVDVVVTNLDFNKGGRIFHTHFARKDFLVNHIFHAGLSTQRYIVRKSLYEQAGGWNETVKCWNDWELGIRILLQNPRVEVLDSGIYVHVMVHDDSITGANYSQNHERREHAITTAINVVEKSKHEQKERLLKFLQYRKVLLAGLYKKEGRLDLAHTLWNEVGEELKNKTLLKCFYWLMYKYVGWGGRGSQRVVKHLVR